MNKMNSLTLSPWFKPLAKSICGVVLFAASISSLEAGGIIGKPSYLTAKRNGSATQKSAVAVKHNGLVAMGLSAYQPPDTLRISNSKPPLPQGMAPVPSDNLGTEVSDGLASSTEAYQNIGIKRVISYLTKPAPGGFGGQVDPSVFSSGVISSHARLRVFVRIDYADSRDQGQPVQVVFNTLNMIPLIYPNDTPMSITYTLGGQLYCQLSPLIIPSNWLYYGLPRFNPTQTSALQLAENPQQYQPIIGSNWLRYSVYGSSQMVSTYTLNVYSFLEFDAVEPILMVHGTASDHTSWNEPPPGILINTNFGNFGILYPFVATATGSGFFDVAQTNYKGLWFSYIDLGGKAFGNESIKNSAIGNGGLKDQIPAILDALGTRSCHIIAHSKGGSDCRYFISGGVDYNFNGNNILMDSNDFDFEKLQIKYKILSLYTIGTPNWGTPISDIVQAVTSNFASSGLSVLFSSDSDIAHVSSLSTIVGLYGQFSNHAPQGQALQDQQTNSKTLNQLQLNGQDAINSINRILYGHLYSLIGDADLDRSQNITGGEGNVLFGWYLLNHTLDHIWNTVGRVGNVNINVIVQANEDDTTAYIELVPYYISQVVEPNDLVTPVWSAIAPNAKIIQVAWTPPFTAIDGTSTSLLQSGYGAIYYSNILSPGNHSLIKNSLTAITILNQIMADYPLNNPKQGAM